MELQIKHQEDHTLLHQINLIKLWEDHLVVVVVEQNLELQDLT
jgi:hypothetical protein